MTVLAAAIYSASVVFGLPPGVLSALCWVESKHTETFNFNDGGSPSIGECQIKTKTARFVGYEGSEELLRNDSNINIYYAAAYLRYQLNRYHQDIWRAVSAYNAGTYRSNNKNYCKAVFSAWLERK